MTERDRNTIRGFALAELAASAGQHEQASEYAGKAVSTAGKWLLSRIAFDHLTVSYKSLVDHRRVCWRTLNWRLQRRQFGNEEHADRERAVVKYMRCLSRETIDLCRDFCTIVDRHLLPGLDDTDSAADVAHALKLKADFLRYTYEVSDGSLKQWSAAKACKSYQRGYDTVCRSRCGPSRDRVRLDLAVNFAVCLECVFGAEHAAAFVRRAILAATETNQQQDDASPVADRAATVEADTEVSKSLRDLREYLTHLNFRCRSDDSVPQDDCGASLDLAPGFCTSDTSDTESEF